MFIRSALGALDVNYNVGREQAVTGEGKLRWRIKVDRAGKQFTTQPVKQEKCDQWKRDIVDLVSKFIYIVLLSFKQDQRPRVN